ncbi:hypothetical protein J9332_44995, partial [Aquimarina celericrescens]|nr:hypothetical protein [Aquimarina celericrescens]
HGDKFKPIINFLTGETKSTTPANLELISWLIDFKKRPLSIYLKTNPKPEDEHETTLLNVKQITVKNEVEKINIPETQVI